MTEEQINIAIAESLAWKRDKRRLGWLSPSNEYADPPNYTASRDACAEFEASLTEDEQQRNYAWYLVQICDPQEQFRLWKSPDELSIWEMSLCDCFTCASAKPIQRCEAYLRTIRKWVDAKLDQFKRDLDSKLKSMSSEEFKDAGVVPQLSESANEALRWMCESTEAGKLNDEQRINKVTEKWGAGATATNDGSKSVSCPKCTGSGFDTRPPNDRPWIHWPCGKCNGSGKITKRDRGRPIKKRPT